MVELMGDSSQMFWITTYLEITGEYTTTALIMCVFFADFGNLSLAYRPQAAERVM